MKKKQNKDKLIAMRITSEQKDRWIFNATLEGLSLSKWIIRKCERYKLTRKEIIESIKRLKKIQRKNEK